VALGVKIDELRHWVDVVCLQETKMASISQRDVLSMLEADFNQFIVLPSVGASGGILVTWR
jgi:exonuclease III